VVRDRGALGLKHVLERTYADVARNRALQSLILRSTCYFVVSLLLALTASLVAVAHRPASPLFDRSQTFIAQFLPLGVFGLLRRVAVFPHERTFVSLGIIGTLWAASSGFSAAMEALNIAYDAGDDRSFWHTRFLACALTFTSGICLLFGLGIVLAGPGFGAWLALRLHLSEWLVFAWPYFRWAIPALLMLFAAEALYFLGPNVRQRVLATLPGVLVAVGSSIAFSGLFEICFRQFANFHVAYITLATSVLLMILWLNATGIAMLAGAALNLELSKLSAKGKLQEKHAASSYTKLDLLA